MLILLTIITSLSLNTIAQSKTLEQCDAVLQKCDTAVRDLEAERAALKGVISAKDLQIKAEADEVLRLRRKDDSVLSNPYFIFGAGLLIGGLAYGLLKK